MGCKELEEFVKKLKCEEEEFEELDVFKRREGER